MPGKKHLRGDIRRFKKIEQQTARIGRTVQTMRREDELELKNPRTRHHPWLVQGKHNGVAFGYSYNDFTQARTWVLLNKPETYTIFKLGPLASSVHIQLDPDHYTVMESNEPYYQKQGQIKPLAKLDPRTAQVLVYEGWLHRKGEQFKAVEEPLMTLQEFFKANKDGIDAEEQAEIITQLKVNGYYVGGGGAAAKWSIELLKPIPFRWSHGKPIYIPRPKSNPQLFGAEIQNNPRKGKLEWITDKGAMPGEPFMVYGYNFDSGPLTIVSIDVGKVEDEYELRDDQGQILKRSTDIEELQVLGEKIYREKYVHQKPNSGVFEVIFYRKGIDENFYEHAQHFSNYRSALKFFNSETAERNLNEYYVTIEDPSGRVVTNSDQAIKHRNPLGTEAVDRRIDIILNQMKTEVRKERPDQRILKDMKWSFVLEIYKAYKVKYGEYPIAFVSFGSSYEMWLNHGQIELDFGQAETDYANPEVFDTIDEILGALHRLKSRGKSSKIIQSDIMYYVEGRRPNPQHNPSISPNEAKNIVKRFLDKKHLPYTKITARHVDFVDLARATPLFVTIHGWQPNPLAADLKGLARDNGFHVDFK